MPPNVDLDGNVVVDSTLDVGLDATPRIRVKVELNEGVNVHVAVKLNGGVNINDHVSVEEM